MAPISAENLIKQMAKLPGIGPKFAERLVFHLANQPKEYNSALLAALQEFNKKIKNCARCGNISEYEICPICQDPRRNQAELCIVESASDIIPLEKTGQYRGLYHILGGLISPHRHIMPENLRIKQLTERIKKSKEIEEMIIATNPTTEGDATALYLAKTLEPFKLKITRLARGLPTGGELEYMDETTLTNALSGRKKM